MTSFGLRVRAGVAALAVLLCVLGTAAQTEAQAAADADAEMRARAKGQFQAGVAAYEAQRYGDALTHFQEAYRIKPHPLVRVNMANCYERLGKLLLAIFHFERFIEESDPSSPQIKEVNDALRALRAKVGEITVRITPDGASVSIDDGERRKAPILEPITLEAGTHTIEVSLAGYQTQKRDIVIEGGQRSDVAFTLEKGEGAVPPVIAAAPAPLPEPPAAIPDPGAAPAPAEVAPQAKDPEAPPPVVEAPEAPSDEPRGLLPVAGWITAGASAAMFLGSLITGQLALSAEADFEDSRDTARDIAGATPLERRGAYTEALEAADRADAFAVASDIFLVAGIVGVGATVYLAIDHHSAGESSSSGASARLTVAPGRISIDGRF
jgi:tetratricopeptide (TPR) repeat protein